jgi:hypothetical protein
VILGTRRAWAARLLAARTLEDVRAAATAAAATAGEARPDAMLVQCLQAAARVAPGAPALALGWELAAGARAEGASTVAWPSSVVAMLLRLAGDAHDADRVRQLFNATSPAQRTPAVYAAALRALQRHVASARSQDNDNHDHDDVRPLGLRLLPPPHADATVHVPAAWVALSDLAPPVPPSDPAVAEGWALWSEMEARGQRADASVLGPLMVLAARRHDSVTALRLFLIARARTGSGDADRVCAFVRPRHLDWDLALVRRLVSRLERDDDAPPDSAHRVVTFLFSWVGTHSWP